jgi:hypothetical protein
MERGAADESCDQDALGALAFTDDFEPLTPQRMQRVVDDDRILGLIPGSM